MNHNPINHKLDNNEKIMNTYKKITRIIALSMLGLMILSFSYTSFKVAANSDVEGFFIPPEYKYIAPYENGLARVHTEEGVGYLSQGGGYVIFPEFEAGGDFTSSVTPLQLGDRFGYVNWEEEWIIPRNYLHAMNFYNRRAKVKTDGGWTYLTLEGGLITRLLGEDRIQRTPKSLGNFSEGLAPVKGPNGFGYINQEGDVEIGLSFESAEGFSEGLARVRREGKWGYINQEGEVIIPLAYDFVLDKKEGLLPVMKEGTWGYINSEGEEVIPKMFDQALPFSEGFARVRMDENWGYINLEGNFVVDPIFEGAMDFSGGYAAVKEGNRWSYINTSGHLLYPFQFERANFFSSNRAPVQVEGLWGLIQR